MIQGSLFELGLINWKKQRGLKDLDLDLRTRHNYIREPGLPWKKQRGLPAFAVEIEEQIVKLSGRKKV